MNPTPTKPGLRIYSDEWYKHLIGEQPEPLARAVRAIVEAYQLDSTAPRFVAQVVAAAIERSTEIKKGR